MHHSSGISLINKKVKKKKPFEREELLDCHRETLFFFFFLRKQAHRLERLHFMVHKYLVNAAKGESLVHEFFKVKNAILRTCSWYSSYR